MKWLCSEDPERRLTASQALLNDWFQIDGERKVSVRGSQLAAQEQPKALAKLLPQAG